MVRKFGKVKAYNGTYTMSDSGIMYKDYGVQKKPVYMRTYAALLAKMGPTRMNEIQREAESTVRELLGGAAT